MWCSRNKKYDKHWLIFVLKKVWFTCFRNNSINQYCSLLDACFKCGDFPTPYSFLTFRFLVTVWCPWTFNFHSELQNLHKKFVLGNILTEFEFWATRKVSFLFEYVFNYAAFCFKFNIWTLSSIGLDVSVID